MQFLFSHRRHIINRSLICISSYIGWSGRYDRAAVVKFTQPGISSTIHAAKDVLSAIRNAISHKNNVERAAIPRLFLPSGKGGVSFWANAQIYIPKVACLSPKCFIDLCVINLGALQQFMHMLYHSNSHFERRPYINKGHNKYLAEHSRILGNFYIRRMFWNFKNTLLATFKATIILELVEHYNKI